MKPPLYSLALLGNSISTVLKQNSERYGILDLNGRSFAFEGIIWSVVILSSTFINTLPSILSPNCLFTGNGFIFGPLTTSTSAFVGAGANIIESSIKNLSGISIVKSTSNSVGSVKTPVIADTAAVSGLTKNTLADRVPLLP